MIDAEGDLAAVLDDCGGFAGTINGPLLGRFVDEAIAIETDSGQTVLSNEPVYYAQQSDIRALAIVNNSELSIDGSRWYVKHIGRPETSGLVRLALKR